MSGKSYEHKRYDTGANEHSTVVHLDRLAVDGWEVFQVDREQRPAAQGRIYITVWLRRELKP